ncbi:MAG: M20 family metallopeptidase [Gammaproteobacteria bacterium]
MSTLPVALAAALAESVDNMADELIEISHAIHGRPELAFQEYFAADTLCAAVTRRGLHAERGVFTLPTAFEAAFDGALQPASGADSARAPTVAVLAEYDALPGIGHACGHNIIATTALGAALALHALAGQLPGRVRLLGTPAEEQGGGRGWMARAGAFNGVDAALMIHPAGLNLTAMPCICVAEVEVIYHGRAAHASAMPHRGINALDALLLAYQSISNLRQHIRPTERIHGIITDGGQAPNIVPERAAGRFFVRAAHERALAALKPRVQACFEAGALGTGATVEVHWAGVDYLDLNSNAPLADTFQRHGEALGRVFAAPALGGAGSTDMGNVSQRVPSIHPMLAAAPPHVVIHHPDFARWAASDLGDQAVVDGAKALALTAAEFLCSPDLQARTRRAFDISRGLT